MGRTLPRVSIGLPVYNGAETIHESIDCLLAQTFQDLEVIISDNASTDKTASICENYARRDGRIRVVRQETNLGAFSNFATVLELASGEYFMWAAADDLWKPEFIDTCVSTLDAAPHVGLVMTGWEIVGRWSGPFFRGIDFPSWSPLNDSDPHQRLTYFVAREDLTHKANFLYGLWHRDLAIKSLNLFRDIPQSFDRNGRDIAILTYALGQRPFAFNPDVMFFKMYKNLPLTLGTRKILATVAAIRRPWRLWHRKATINVERQKHQALLKIGLEALGLNPRDIENLLNSASSKF